MSLFLHNLVVLVCSTLDCNTTQADEVLHLLQTFKWDADALVLSLIAAPHSRDLSSPLPPTLHPTLSPTRTLSSPSSQRLSPSNCISLNQRKFRCLSSVMRRLKLRDVRAGTTSKDQWVPSRCACGSVTRPSDMFALTQCSHWRCRNCWVGVITSSLHYTETEGSGSPSSKRDEAALWKCPHTDPLGHRCDALLGGEFASHLLGPSYASVRRSYYLSELRTCASRLSTPMLSSGTGSHCTSISICPSLAGAAVMSWWAAVTHSSRRPSPGETSTSPSRTMSVGSHEDAWERERDNNGSETPSSIVKTMVICKRLLDARSSAETRCVEAAVAADHALDGPSFIRFHALSDQYALIASASSVLSQVYILLSFEAECSEECNIDKTGKGRSTFEDNEHHRTDRECFTDTCSLLHLMGAMEKLIISFSEAVTKLSVLRSLDPQFQGPQTRALTTQIRIMTAALRRLLWDLCNRVSSTHKYVKNQ